MSFSRETVLSALGQAYANGLKVGEIADSLGVRKKDHQKLRHLLSSMVRDGDIERVGRAAYAVARPGAGDRPSGRITVHPAGYGFVDLDDGSEDVFVPAKYRGSALDGDHVTLETWEGYKGTEGRVIDVLSRGRAKLTGTLRRAGRTIYVEPDDPRIATDYGHIGLDSGAGGGKVGEAVVVEISQYPSAARQEMRGRVVRVLGDPEDPRTEIEKIIVCADIPVGFPDDAKRQADATPQELRAEDFADRIDLRDRPFLSIDPETARDFDDALCIEKGPHGGPRVWVAVADVSHYVRPDDALDQEAVIRGVSVYLPDRVIPMLPFPLSAGICSLNPEVDRCAMVVRMDFDASGVVRDTGFAAAVIRSHARLDYPGVAAALSGDFRGRREQYRRWVGMLEEMHELAQKMRARRIARGSLQLEIAEAKVILDADDPLLVRDVVRSKGSEDIKEAYQLVEEFMIAANEAVGAFFSDRGLTTVWRIHAPPERERVEELAETLGNFGIDVDPEHAVTPVGMKEVLEAIGDRPGAEALSFLVLRSLKQAVYDTGPIGHFGLASESYLHFTSPIRRYPDLLAHRLLKYYLHQEGQASGGGGRFRPPAPEALQELASSSSSHERRAMEAEREAVAMYRAYLVRDQVGDEFTGRISGVTSFGAFVEIDEPFIEGLIRIDSLGAEPFHYDPLHMTLRGKRSGLMLSLGDTVLVEIANVSVTLRRIELRLLSSSGEQMRPEPGRETRRRSAKKQAARAPARKQSRTSSKTRTGKGGAKPRAAQESKGKSKPRRR